MIRLLSSNYREVEFAHSSAVSVGDFMAKATLGGALNAFAFQGYEANAKGAYVTFAEKASATKVAGDALAFAPGEKVRYNVAGAKVSKTATDPLIGYAKRAALAADVEVIIEFDGELEARAFADLADVDVAGVTDNDTLKYVASTGKWTDVAV